MFHLKWYNKGKQNTIDSVINGFHRWWYCLFWNDKKNVQSFGHWYKFTCAHTNSERTVMHSKWFLKKRSNQDLVSFSFTSIFHHFLWNAVYELSTYQCYNCIIRNHFPYTCTRISHNRTSIKFDLKNKPSIKITTEK